LFVFVNIWKAGQYIMVSILCFWTAGNISFMTDTIRESWLHSYVKNSG